MQGFEGSQVDPTLIKAVLAVENLERGRLRRRLEYEVARALLRVGATKRVSRMTLGIAQLRPESVLGEDTSSAVATLKRTDASVGLCASFIRRACIELNLDPVRPDEWPISSWGSIGLAYNGTVFYGRVLRAAYQSLENDSQDRRVRA